MLHSAVSIIDHNVLNALIKEVDCIRHRTTAGEGDRTGALGSGDDNKSFGELALFDKTTVGNMFSTAQFATFLGQTGTQVKVTYTINMVG